MSTARFGSNPVQATNLEEKIRFRAYELFQKRGGEHGRALDDWLQAEAELMRSKMGPGAVAASQSKAATVKRASTRRNST